MVFNSWEMQHDEKDCSSGQLVIGSFITTRCPLLHHILCRVFLQNIKLSTWLSPLQPRFGALPLLAFPKTKITFEREKISDRQWDSGKYDGTTDGNSKKGFCRVFCRVEETLGEWYGVLRCPLWWGLRHPCPVYNVPCTFFNKCLFFILHG